MKVNIPIFPFSSCISPYKILRNIWWCMRWHAKFTIGGEPYGAEEKIYLTRVRLGLSEGQWEVRKPHTSVHINFSIWLGLYDRLWTRVYNKEGKRVSNALYGLCNMLM